MTDIILIAIVLVIIASTLLYLRRAKKQGQVCIGCPHAKQCSSRACRTHSQTSKNSTAVHQ